MRNIALSPGDLRLWPVGALTVTAVGRAEFLPALLLTGE
jgi:hypothetical protein